MKSGIPKYCPDEDDKAATEESEHEDAVCTQKRESEEADISEASAKKRRVALINSRKLVYKVISRVKRRKFDENIIEKTEISQPQVLFSPILHATPRQMSPR